MNQSLSSSGVDGASGPRRPPEDEGEPIAEPLFPQVSLRFLFGLTVLMAGVLWTNRAAWVGDQLWAKSVMVVLGTVAGCFVVYALLFLLALVIATITVPVMREVFPRGADANPHSTTEEPEAPSG